MRLAHWLALTTPGGPADGPAEDPLPRPGTASEELPAGTSPGIVVIGRNEAPRLARTLNALLPHRSRTVYVDSASVDGSAGIARELGFDVLELDPSQPMSAARGRNAGFRYLVDKHPGLALVQFFDGDSEPLPGYLEQAVEEFRTHPQAAVVTGIIRERHPDASVYNRLCALEWDRPLGDIPASGGNMMVRTTAFDAVGDFRPDVVAGEEEELCLRLRRSGWTVRRIGVDMVLHDADLATFRQWWKRTVRTGQGYAQGATMHGSGPEGHYRRQALSAVCWGLGLPAASLLAAAGTRGRGLVLLGAYGWLGRRIYRHGRSRGWSPEDSRLYAVFTVIGKLGETVGVGRYAAAVARGRGPVLIEHKRGLIEHQHGAPPV